MSLPPQFSELEVFEEWALATERERTALRNTSQQSDLVAFHAAMKERLGEILPYLDGMVEEDLGHEDRNLFLMTLSLMEVSLAVENYEQPSVVDGADFRRWVPAQ